MAKYEEVKEVASNIKKFIKLLITNIGWALLLIAIIAIYLIPLYYIVTSYIDHIIKGLLMFTWVVLWIILLITYYQYTKKD